MSLMRSEPCVCGGLITVPDMAPSPAPYVEAHNFLPGHQAWRARKEGWHYTRNDRYDDPRRERPTASQAGASGATGSVRVSAPAPAGASVAAVRGAS